MNGVHSHRCGLALGQFMPEVGCGHTWSHPDSTIDAPNTVFKEAHRCPRCGRGPWTYKVETSGEIEAMLKDYLNYENERNHKNHALYERLMRRALGQDTQILVKHHLTFEVAGQEPNEVPSADTLMFDHDLMTKVFGHRALAVMAQLAIRAAEERDEKLLWWLERVEAESTGAEGGL